MEIVSKRFIVQQRIVHPLAVFDRMDEGERIAMITTTSPHTETAATQRARLAKATCVALPTATANPRVRPSAVASDTVSVVRDLDAELVARTSRMRLRSSVRVDRS